MATLNSWQKISRVLSSDFGDGASGSATISSDPNTRATFTGTATQTTGTAGSTDFANGDLVMIHQTQGTGVGQWEINSISSGGGSTSLTFSTALNYSYVSGAQIIKIPRYTTATVSGFTVTAWNGSTGGISIIAANSSTSITGTMTGTGGNGGTTDSTGGAGTGGGFRGGNARDESSKPAFRGEGINGNNTTASVNASGNAGGGGQWGDNGGFPGPGGGGGNGTAGSRSTYSSSNAISGYGGSTSGAADLTTITFGGGGGGGSSNGYTAGAGGAGGGIFIIISKNITISGGVSVNGGAGGNGNLENDGGGGAGGSCLIVCSTATVGTNLITAAAGSGQQSNSGGVGRIAIHYKTSVSGTTSPTYTGVQDTSLKEGGVTNFFAFF